MLLGASAKNVLKSLSVIVGIIGASMFGAPSWASTDLGAPTERNSQCTAERPPTPSGETVTLEDGVIRVSWTPIPNVKEYVFNLFLLVNGQWQSDSGTDWRVLPPNQNSFSFVVPAGAQVMRVNIAARNYCQQSENNFWSQAIPRVADAPIQVRLTALQSEMRISWDTNCLLFQLGCGGLTYVARLDPGGLECTVVGGSECLISGVQRDQDYIAYVYARNQYGPSPVVQSNVARLVKAPRSPVSVKVSPTQTSASIQWKRQTSSSGVSYIVSTTPQTRECRTTRSVCVIKGLKPNTRYRFSVIALNDGGSSSPSVVTASTKPVRPSGPSRPARPSRPSPTQTSPPSPPPPPSPPSPPEKPALPIS